ncbi:SANT/Myb domain [Sesbania bispinosa]|nr:SANT/Myb domain [Sesbania bispinosa]
MTLHTVDDDDHDDDNLSTSDDDDEGLKEDMAALARACMIAAPAEPHEVNTEDPLLRSGDALVPITNYEDSVVPGSSSDNAIVPVTTDSDDDDLDTLKRVQSLYKPLVSSQPIMTMPTVSDGDDDEDDFETVRSIFKRFSTYDRGFSEGRMEKLAEGDQGLSLDREDNIADSSISHKSDAGKLSPVSQSPNNDVNFMNGDIEMPDEAYESDAGEASKLPHRKSSLPPEALAIFDAIKKNRDLQKFLRNKMIVMEAKIEENKQLMDKLKILRDFEISCSRKTGNALSLKKDPRVQLISARKSFDPNNSKRVSPMWYGPAENSRVANYKMVLERFPLSLDRKKWSNVERENLSKGIKQQFQEMVLQTSLDRMSLEGSSGGANDMDSICASVKDLEITPESIREFLPKVNWDRLASMYVVGHTGAECESRWLNCEDPLINHGPWAREEDRSLLIIVQDMGIRNWFDIAAKLGTNRTPFQCLARYQRSLNPSMLNSEWTAEEDAQLCSAVEFFGESNWQSVASVLERRTGTQCSNRWKKSLRPVRKGSFSQEEDMRLTVAVMLFGRKWSLIAKFVPGRIQSQCRDRYLNSLDPSLKWGGWTEEEDSKLEAAIVKHGFCWSKVAADVPPRTDSQCRKRWKVLFPEQVPLLQEARRRQKSLVPTNFVDRESERPALTLNDFLPIQTLAPPSDADALDLPGNRKRKSSNAPKKSRARKRVKKVPDCPEEVQDIVVYSDEVRTGCEGVLSPDVPKKRRSKRLARRARVCLNDAEEISGSDEVKTGNESSEIQDTDNITLACFLKNKSKKKGFKCAKNVSLASFSSRTTIVSKLVENQTPSVEQDELSLPCGTDDETKNLFIQQNGASQGQVRKPGDSTTNLTGDDDDMTLACLMGNKAKKLNKTTKGRNAPSSSKLKKGSALRREVHGGNKPTIIADGSGPSMSKLAEEDTVLHGDVTEPTNMNVEEEDDLLASFLQNKAKKKGGRRDILKGKC